MGIEIRLFLVIDALSRFSGTPIACSAGLFLQLAKQLLDSTAAASGGGRASGGVGGTAGPWRRLGKAPLTPRITRFLVPANNFPCDQDLAAAAVAAVCLALPSGMERVMGIEPIVRSRKLNALGVSGQASAIQVRFKCEISRYVGRCQAICGN